MNTTITDLAILRTHLEAMQYVLRKVDYADSDTVAEAIGVAKVRVELALEDVERMEADHA